MYRGYEDNRNISLKLSQVLGEIGLNENVMMRRQASLLNETITTLTAKLRGDNYMAYLFGSQTEGTTTVGLDSDQDELICRTDIAVVQSLDGVKKEDIFLIVVNESTSKGYCYIKPFTDAQKLLMLGKQIKGEFLSNEKQKYFKGTVHGPALTTLSSGHSYDVVEAYYCASWPTSASGWLDRQGRGGWPTQEMKRDCISKGFFLVPVGSKVSTNPDIEWRISTSLAERCLMFSLNITQLRCYVLMKMITKSYFEIDGETRISSFMCKTTLFHCIENSEPSMWTEANLYIGLFVCLLQLRFFVQSETCPHFIITENNLMEAQYTLEERNQLLESLNELLHTYGLGLLDIKIDDLGKRLQLGMNIIHQESAYDLLPQECYHVNALFRQNLKLFLVLEGSLLNISECTSGTVLELQIQELIKIDNDGKKLERAACSLLIAELRSVSGSVMASSGINKSGKVSGEALACFEKAMDSICKRLKLAAIYYCSGNMGDTENILMYIQEMYDTSSIINIPCSCNVGRFNPKPSCQANDPMRETMFLKSGEKMSELFKYFGTCVWFSRIQLYCIPRELRYEMFRYSEYEMCRLSIDDVFDRRLNDIAMQNLVVVDYLPFFYFLHYKTYSRLQRNKDKQLALSKLAKVTTEDKWLGHKETSLNLLGQCCEQEHRIADALTYYLASLQLKDWNNVAKWHVCKLLARIVETRFGSTTVIYRRTVNS